MSIKFEMTNDELATAIKEAHWMATKTARNEDTYQSVIDHYRALLKIQIARAGRVVIDIPNV